MTLPTNHTAIVKKTVTDGIMIDDTTKRNVAVDIGAATVIVVVSLRSDDMVVAEAVITINDMKFIGVRADIIIIMKTISISDGARFQVRYHLILFSSDIIDAQDTLQIAGTTRLWAAQMDMAGSQGVRLPNPSSLQVKPLGVITTRFCHLTARCLLARFVSTLLKSGLQSTSPPTSLTLKTIMAKNKKEMMKRLNSAVRRKSVNASWNLSDSSTKLAKQFSLCLSLLHLRIPSLNRTSFCFNRKLKLSLHLKLKTKMSIFSLKRKIKYNLVSKKKRNNKYKKTYLSEREKLITVAWPIRSSSKKQKLLNHLNQKRRPSTSLLSRVTQKRMMMLSMKRLPVTKKALRLPTHLSMTKAIISRKQAR